MAKSRQKKPRKISESTFKKYCHVLDEYILNGGNGTEAYMKFYPRSSRKAADPSFRGILEIPRCVQYLKKRHEAIQKKAGINIEELVGFLANLVRMDIADVFNDDGTMKNLSDMPEHIRQAIVGINISDYTYQDGSHSQKKKVKIESKLAAVEKLFRHFGAYDKDNRQRRPVMAPIISFEKTRKKK